MEVVKVGVIGLGNMGSAHAKCIYENEINGLKLAAICDNDSEVLEFFKKEFPNVASFQDYKQMIKEADIDAIIIATPHYIHPEIAICGFKNNKHVLSEKPAGVSVSDVKKMNEEAKKSQTVFSIMFNQRTNFLFRELKSKLERKEFGEIKRVTWNITNWYRTQEYYNSGGWRATWAGEGGGVLINQAPHNLDILQWLFGVPDKVFAKLSIGKYHNIEVEDDAQILMEYNNGMNAVFITSTGEAPGTNRLEISATKGKAVLENGKLMCWLSSTDEREYCFNSLYHSSHMNFDYSEISDTGNDSSHKGILQNFTNAILNNEPLIANGTDGINELFISNAAYLSHWKNQWVEINNFPFCEFDEKLEVLKKNSNVKPKRIKLATDNEYKERWKVRW